MHYPREAFICDVVDFEYGSRSLIFMYRQHRTKLVSRDRFNIAHLRMRRGTVVRSRADSLLGFFRLNGSHWLASTGPLSPNDPVTGRRRHLPASVMYFIPSLMIYNWTNANLASARAHAGRSAMRLWWALVYSMAAAFIKGSQPPRFISDLCRFR